MLTGVAVLGVLAGSLASFFRLGDNEKANGPPPDQPASPAAASDVALQALTSEVAALRRQVEALTRRLTGTPGDLTANEPSSGEDAAG
jgi:voltage-gated potassium channel